ncbi:MAG: glycosyltransferase family 4 protein [Victivallales bacterium]|nr:glycosyltransferase family 4 protein [Victivallales bacterium]
MVFDTVFVHLLNDFSGSPRVLKNTIDAVTEHSRHAKLYLGSYGDGFLSSCAIPVSHFGYVRSSQRFLTLISFLFSQMVLFLKLLCDRSIDKDAVVYINTVLPFGAALYAKLSGRKVVYHVHEISVSPAILRFFLLKVVQLTSSVNIYVSDAHMIALPVPGVPAKRIYNALDSRFLELASDTVYASRYNDYFNVLLIASLRDYKGIPELLNLAASVVEYKEIRFKLVVNDDEDAISTYFSGKQIPPNLIIYPRTNDIAIFYQQANLVLNLSRVDQWVETFGLTILEAMAFGIPVIVPPVGGPKELVDDGIQGFKIDSYDLDLLKKKLLLLFQDETLCEKMSLACRKRAEGFSPAIYGRNIVEVLDHVGNTKK